MTTTAVHDVPAWTSWVCDVGEQTDRCGDRGSSVAWPRRMAVGALRAVQAYTVGDVVVLGVAGRLDGVVVDEVDRAVGFALAEEPRAVLCDLSGVVDGVQPYAVEVLASVGRHVRDWPGVPVGIACPDGAVRDALHHEPLSAHLTITGLPGPALRAVGRCPPPATAVLRLPRHPGAPRAARAFITRTCLDWQLPGSIPASGLIARVFVADAMVGAVAPITVSVARGDGCLRLAVRRRGTDGSAQRAPSFPPGRRWGPVRVQALSRAWGVLPAADGGTVVWAVLGA